MEVFVINSKQDKQKLELSSAEVSDWQQSIAEVIKRLGVGQTQKLLTSLSSFLDQNYSQFQWPLTTDYINTISKKDQPKYPGDHELEWKIRSLIRWNAMAMVVGANRKAEGIGGHISSFASAATLYEVGFCHFFRGPEHQNYDLVFFQGHVAPGIYARAFLEGRFSTTELNNFRRELAKPKGLSSYPHPYLMPDFWQFPTVSMGLGPLLAIYQARFNRYLAARGFLDSKKYQGKVVAFVGDGEMDEPEAQGALTLAGREKLGNLIFVVNCNLQRLDGPVRGNAKIIQELEALYRGAGWKVIKVIWGSDWDELLESEVAPNLIKIMNETVDGEFQNYWVKPGEYAREHFFGRDPKVKAKIKSLSDEQIRRLRRGGHDATKVYAAYQKAYEYTDGPVVILAKTIKGYGLGEAGEGKNITHQQKKLNEDELREFRNHYAIPISDEEVISAPFYKPKSDSKEIKYLLEKRKKLGGFLPSRQTKYKKPKLPGTKFYDEFLKGSDERAVSTTMAFVKILAKLLNDKELGPKLVPIVADEARTFGMEALFRRIGIYAPFGQKYQPVDKENLLYYREEADGQILEEGITEAGATASFIAAGTSYATHGVATIPFYIFYSMFGAGRVFDLLWLAGDMQTKGFLLGATAGRTTLAGEGLQHQDGHSPLFFLSHPSVRAYDPAFAYEISAIVEDGLIELYQKDLHKIYYLSLGNENYVMPEKAKAVSKKEICDGAYLYQQFKPKKAKAKVVLLGSGSILLEVIKAAELLVKKQIEVSVFSVTSYPVLYQQAVGVQKHNLEHPKKTKQNKIEEIFQKHHNQLFIAASDYVCALPQAIASWVPGPYFCLGTDGFGLSETRASLRKHFQVDHQSIVQLALAKLGEG